MVQLLLNKSAEVIASGGDYGRSLQAASYRDHDSVEEPKFLILSVRHLILKKNAQKETFWNHENAPVMTLDIEILCKNHPCKTYVFHAFRTEVQTNWATLTLVGGSRRGVFCASRRASQTSNNPMETAEMDLGLSHASCLLSRCATKLCPMAFLAAFDPAHTAV